MSGHRVTVKGQPMSSPAAIAPIATASENQKDDDDNENEVHVFLQNV
jgi:hypothetical protein